MLRLFLAVAWGVFAAGAAKCAEPREAVEGAEILDADPWWRSANHACGPLCLKFLCEYYQTPKSYVAVAHACRPGPLGSSLEEVRAAAVAFGFYALPFQTSADRLKAFACPAILHVVRDGGAEHFVALLGYDRATDAFRVFDPPMALRHVDSGELTRQFTGMGLFVSPTPLASLDELNGLSEPIAFALKSIAALDLTVVACAVSYGFRRRRAAGGRAAARAICLFIVPALVCGLAGCGVREAPVSGSAGVGVKPEGPIQNHDEFDFGNVQPGIELRHVFNWHNATGQRVRILKIENNASCSCTMQPKLNTDVVEPGKSAQLTLAISTGRSEREILHRVVLHTDSDQEAARTLDFLVKANIRAYWDPTPPRLVFGTVYNNGAPVTRELRIESRFVEDVGGSLQSIRAAKPFVQAAKREARRGVATFDVTLAADTPIGAFAEWVEFRFDNADAPTLMVEIVGRKEGDLALVPPRLILDRLEVDPIQEHRIRISSRTAQPFRILKIQSPAGIDADWSPKDAGSPVVVVKLIVKAEARSPKILPIEITTDRGDEPRLQFDVIDPISQQAPR